MTGKRVVYCKDSTAWLKKKTSVGAIITSLPDMEEIQIDKGDYLVWFKEAAKLCMRATTKGCPTIFYQTDRKANNKLLSKAALLFSVASELGLEVVWHKIVLRVEVEKKDLFRPGYTHLICFGDGDVKAGSATPDVMKSGGVLYPNGMGLSAAHLALEYASRFTDKVCDPFCGRGTVLLMAERLGFKKIVGLDIDQAQVDYAEKLQYGSANLKRSPKSRNRLLEI